MHRLPDVVTSHTAPIAQLYQQCAPQLLTYIRRHIVSREDAEDILLETFLAAIENRHIWHAQEDSQQAWLWRVARNKIVDHQRRAIRRPLTALDETLVETLFDNEELAPELLAVQSEDHARLREYVATLPHIQQEVLRLRFAYGLRCTEIARRLNKSNGAIRMLLTRTLNFLRDIYGQQHTQFDSNKEERNHGSS